ncbi:MAG: heavy metal translocating P-type ATPase, partial [Desulfuromonas sp.]
YSIALYAGYFHGIEPHVRQIIQYFAAAVTTPVVFYSGWPFLTGALRSLRNRTPNMDLLVALGVLTAYIYSIFAMLRDAEVYFDSAGMIVTLILLGRLLESSARNRSISGIDRLLQLAPDTARQTDGNKQWTVQSVNLKPGDSIIVLPGERVPVDAIVADGESEFDESAVTGESLPVCRGVGARVTSGSLNLSSSMTLKVEKIKSESFISRMNRLVEEAQNRKAPVQLLADRIAAFFVPLVIIMAVATFLFWLFIGGTNPAVLNAVAVLVVACPCALGLATPTAILVATGKAASAGILFRGGDMMEAASRINTVAFDKTGTLTRGKPIVTRILPAHDISSDQLLTEAAAIASGSNHPLALSILHKAQTDGVTIPPPVTTETVPGRGLVIKKDGHVWRLGSRTFMVENDISALGLEENSGTEVHVAVDREYRGRIIFTDELRPEAETAVNELHRHNINTALLSGDREAPVRKIAKALKINEIEAAIDPAGKAAWIKSKQELGRIVAMVGDGINDTPALSQADVGCAMAGGTDIALETSDLVLTRPDFKHLIAAFKIARKCMAAIRQNLFWAFSYNLIAIPLAASGYLAPVWAAAAMASSSLLVIGNSLRLGASLQKGLAIGNSQD